MVVAAVLGAMAVWLGVRGPPVGTHPLGRGASAVVGARGEQVLVLGGAARVADVLDELAALHVGSVDVVLVTAGGAARPAGTIIEELGADRVIAADRSGLPAARQLEAGRLRVGSVVLDVVEHDHRWRIDPV